MVRYSMPSIFRSNQARLPASPWWFVACLIGVSVCWTLQYPFWPNREFLLDQGKLVDYSWLAFTTWAGGLAIWLWAMWSLLVRFHGLSFARVRTMIVVTTAAVYASFIAMYPTNAIDVYIYAARSRLLTSYGENPNGFQPVVHWESDPYMRFASREWADNLSPYGPLWNQLAAPMTWIGGDSIGAAVIGFKLLSAASAITIAWLIYSIVNDRHPEWALPAALFWLWNPLVLWDGIGNAHNDVTLMLPVVAALWSWQKRRDHMVVPWVLVSILIKYVTVILIPVAIIAVWRRTSDHRTRATIALWSATATIGLLAVSMFPFYDVDAIVASLREQGTKVAASPAWAIRATLREWSIADVPAQTIINVAYALIAVVITSWMVAVWRRPDRLPRAVFEVMFIFMIVASTNQRAWYVIWLVPLAAILIPAMPWRRALLWSVTSMIGHGCTIWLWYVWDFDAWGSYPYVLIIVGLVYLPVIVLSLWELLAWWRSRRDENRRADRSDRAGTEPGLAVRDVWGR